MGRRLIPFIAFRHLRTRRRATLLTLLGVAIGVFVVMVMQSLMFGFQGEFRRILLTVTPGILVRGRPVEPPGEGRLYRNGRETVYLQRRTKPPEKEKGIRNYRQLEERLLALPGVTAVAPLVQGNAMLRFGTRRRGVSVVALQAPRYDRVVEFRSKVLGDADALTRRRDGVILGVLLAEEMGVPVGARVSLVGSEGRRADLRVVALFRSGITPVDRTYLFINLPVGQNLLGYPTAATHLALRVVPLDRATAVARQIEFATGLEAQSWQEANAVFFALMRQQNAINFSAVGMTLIVAGFGIANSLITVVLEKRRDIGILRAMGLTQRQVAGVFLTEGALIGVLGAAVGVAAGAWAIDVMARTPLPARGGLSGAQTFLMLRTPAIYVAPAIYALVVSLLASFFPALRAARYDPVEIIRTAR